MYLFSCNWQPVDTSVDRFPGPGSEHASKEGIQVTGSQSPAVFLHPLHISFDQGLPESGVVQAEAVCQGLKRAEEFFKGKKNQSGIQDPATHFQILSPIFKLKVLGSTEKQLVLDSKYQVSLDFPLHSWGGGQSGYRSSLTQLGMSGIRLGWGLYYPTNPSCLPVFYSALCEI